jgi:hypothetical protein
VVSYEFKRYRSLMQDLQKFGISNEPDPAAASKASRETVASNDVPVTLTIDHPFPPTLSKTSLGISLSETELSQRCHIHNHSSLKLLNLILLF